MQGTRTTLLLVAMALAGSPHTAAAATAWLGLPGGTSLAYSGGTGGWSRAAAADLPDAGYDAAPALADLDGDGDRDALVGERSGRVLVWENTGTDAAPLWLRRTAWDPGLDVGYNAAPAAADLDRDGDVDLIVGSSGGALRGLRNGGRTAPSWTAYTAWDVAAPGAHSQPALGDVDGDGRLDLLVGTSDGAVRAYAGVGTVSAPFSRQAAWDPPSVGASAAPALGAIDGDAAPDLLIADASARVLAYRNAGGGTWSAIAAPPDPGSGPATPALAPSPTGGSTNGTPVARLTASPTSGTAPLAVRFDASASTDPDGDPLAWSWTFGDGATASGAVVTHTYQTAGSYTARVTVRDGAASASASATIAVSTGGTPPGGGGDGDADGAQGFGAGTDGGAGGRVIRVTAPTDAAVRSAFKTAATGNAVIVFDTAEPIPVADQLPSLTGPNITIEGNGATLVGRGLGRSEAMVEIKGHDVIVRNLRLRSGGDNLRIQGNGAYNVLVSHVSSTGSGDDGLSIAYGAHDVTVQWSFLAGNTRSIFLKYGATNNVSIHHTWIMKQWSRGPLVSGSVRADLRNLIVEDWTSWGTRFESESSGNMVNSIFFLSPYAASLGGKADGALVMSQSGPVFTAGNVFRGVARPRGSGSSATPVDAPAVTTLSVAEMEPLVRARAGCLPRDQVDEAYIAATTGWKVGQYTPYRIEP